MDDSAHKSICVAPLHFKKQRSALDSISTQNASVAQQPNGQMTPPLTPRDTDKQSLQDTDFHAYLRAYYPFHPSYEQGTSSITLPLNSGDIILVHSIHTNGWADGTLLSSGARGWLPTNYCEGYYGDPISTLLKALTIFWDLVKSTRFGDYTVFCESHYVGGLVAGVRCLLVWNVPSDRCMQANKLYKESTHCLSRECPLVKSSLGVRKTRRALLSDLSAFVKLTKIVESSLKAPDVSEELEIDVEELMLKAFKVVTRAVKFMDVWEDHMQSLNAARNYGEVPPTPPAERTDFSEAERAENLELASPRPNAEAHAYSERPSTDQTSARPRFSRASQTYVRPGSSRDSCRQSTRQTSSQDDSYVAHRVSCVMHPGSQNLASDRLGDLYNTFLTYLGYFVGIHIQSRSSTELLLTTKQAVCACRDLLELVGEIWERDRKRSGVLTEVRDEMYNKITVLAETAQSALQPLRSTDDDLVIPSDGRTLTDAATACVRIAGECVAECRLIIDRIGDFDFPAVGLGISNLEASEETAPAESSRTNKEGNQSSLIEDSPVSLSAHQALPPQSLGSGVNHESVASTALPETKSQDACAESEAGQCTSSQPQPAEALLPPLPELAPSLFPRDDKFPSAFSSIGSTHETTSPDGSRNRKDSFGVSSAGDGSGYIGSMRDSEASAVSQTSTRATSPDMTFTGSNKNQSFTASFNSSQRGDADADDIEADLLERTFAHELVYNKEGQITGGTLPALIERLTTPDSTPDATFVSTFYLTFRLFVTPCDFAQALIDRFDYIGDSPRTSSPVRLRVYNVFKGWLESHWRNDCDKPSLDLIKQFATRQLQIIFPKAGRQLLTLVEKVTTVNGPLVPRLISSIGKTNTSIAQYIHPDTPMPPSVITKSQLNALKNWKLGSATVTILDFDPLELARQLTIKESQIFCSILPEELLASEWTKQSGSLAVNVRSMSRLATDLGNLVADNILQTDDAKKRAVIIKQWTKIADKLLDLSNFHSMMAIVCSLTQSTIQRLKRTWEHVSNKTKLRLEKLKIFINHDRNYASLRQTFQNQSPPCIPWVGLYLTDLTFVDAGNQTTRQLRTSSTTDGFGHNTKSVINVDKHMKIAKIISELQRFQVPYRLGEIPELQTWMQDQFVRVRTVDQCAVIKDYYRRSLLLEPRASPETQNSSGGGREKFELFSLAGLKAKGTSSSASSPVAQTAA